jgi:hypothetical protein
VKEEKRDFHVLITLFQEAAGAVDLYYKTRQLLSVSIAHLSNPTSTRKRIVCKRARSFTICAVTPPRQLKTIQRSTTMKSNPREPMPRCCKLAISEYFRRSRRTMISQSNYECSLLSIEPINMKHAPFRLGLLNRHCWTLVVIFVSFIIIAEYLKL